MSNTGNHTGHTPPVCPICSGKLKRNKKRPGRLICRHCNMTFDEKRIFQMWTGNGYKKVGRKEQTVDEVLAQAGTLLDELWGSILRNASITAADGDSSRNTVVRKNTE